MHFINIFYQQYEPINTFTQSDLHLQEPVEWTPMSSSEN